MDLTGEYRIAAPRERVWALLNDPDVLRACIPGCDSLEGNLADGLTARVTTKIGPIKATFDGAVTFTNVRPGEGYMIGGEGKGGVAGFAKGGADVNLADDAENAGGTVLTYQARAQVGGKLAQLGGRLIDSTAKKLADQFFACFAAKADGGAAGAGAGGADTPEVKAATAAAALAQGDATAGLPVGDVILPGAPIPPAATGVAIVGGQATAPESLPPAGRAFGSDLQSDHEPSRTAMPDPELDPITPMPPETLQQTSGASVEALAHKVEDEVEREAAAGFLGGPYVWGLLVILLLLFVYVIAT